MKDLIAVVGPTATGKTEYAIQLAERLDGEIVSCDSMQLYKFMDIGSAKPGKEQRKRVRHYLVDEIDPREPFSAAQYQKLAKKAIAEIRGKGKLPILAGGTGLYLNSILYEMDFSSPPSDSGYRQKLWELSEREGKDALHRLLVQRDPQAAARIHPNNTKKVIRALEAARQEGQGIRPFSEARRPSADVRPFLIGITWDREQLYDRINRRVLALMEQGLLEEVDRLLSMGLTEDHISMKGIGYKELIAYRKGEWDLRTAVEKIQQNTRHYAKRQLTWFRRYDKIKWFNLSGYESGERALEDMMTWLKEKR